MSVLIKHMVMPKGCIYANDKDQTEYCPLLNHDDVPFCQYIENEPEIAIGIDERPVYCPLSDVSEPCQDTVSRQAAIDALDEIRHALWEIDIPSPTVPEYVEHHEQVQSVWKLLDKKQKELYVLPSAQPEPCEDAVSRHRLLSDLEELIVAWEKYPVMAEQRKGVETAIGYVKTIPSITPNQRWIPVTERLPENDNEVLITVWDAEDDYVEVYKGFYQDHEWWTQWCHGCLKIKDEPCGENIVIAWMPLPEPYREDGKAE